MNICCEGIWMEQILEWAWDIMSEDGGDGTSLIICTNAKELFEKAKGFFGVHLKGFDVDDIDLCFRNGQEGLYFSSDSNNRADYTFILNAEPQFGGHKLYEGKFK